MSRSRKGSKGPGYDYWGRRALSGFCGYGPQIKKETTRRERSRAKRKIRENPEALPEREAL